MTGETIEIDPVRRARLQWRFRLGVCSLLLGAVAFVQSPGRIVTDTKLDLAVDPGGFLARSMHLWDGLGAFGQVQNQAYGYLFPMGSFFWVGDLLTLPPWVVQRLWWSVVLIVAFLGFVKLCSALNLGAPWVRVLGGFAFALSPRFLTVIGPSSIELWPSAVAPWVLVPLVIGLRRGSPRRMAAMSAVAVACIGGVNAAATFAVIPLGALWLLLAAPSPRRKQLMLWWPLSVLLATAWWLVPLFLLGRYSPPFLDYIESAANTTIATDLFDTVRGTSNWLPYIDSYANAGNLLLTQPVLIANGLVVLTLGVLGLARRDLPHRQFLVGGLFVGVLMVSMGHVGAVSGIGSEAVQHLLDGVLAPLRNTHKFDVVLRLPLVLGLVHAVSVLVRDPKSPYGPSAVRATATGMGVAVLASVAVLGATVPAWTAALANRASFTEVPGYWKDTADWLGSHPNGTALLAPATPFGDYVWGKTGDEPMQPLATTPWAVRNLIPLAPGGNIEMLDTISRRFATGQGSEGFGDFLRRAGIGYVVVRNDIKRDQDVVDPALVYATLTSTPGVRSVKRLGPLVGGGPTLTNDAGKEVFVNGGRQVSRPAVEVFEIGDVRSGVTAQDRAGTPVVVGSTDSLLSLDDAGTTANGSTIFAQDADPKKRPEHLILTDGIRRQEASFGSVNHSRSASMTVDEPYSSNRPVSRYDQDAVEPWTSAPVLDGADHIRASSSQSEVGSLPRIEQSAQPWSAFDRDDETTWRADYADAGETSWVEIGFAGRRLVGTASITLGLPRGQQRALTITTESGDRTVQATGGRPVTVDVGRVRTLRVSGPSTGAQPLAISDITLSEVQVSRPLRLPTLPTAWGNPEQILLDSGSGYDDGCLAYDGVMRCSAADHAQGDDGRSIDRIVPLQGAGRFEADLVVAPRGGASLTSLVQQGQVSTIAASSQIVDSPRASAVRAIDGDDRTGWVAEAEDPDPTLSLNWVGERRISRLAIRTDADLAATPPTKVLLRFPDGTSQQVGIRAGMARFDPVRTSSVEVHLLGGPRRFSVGFSGGVSELPVGVSEMSVPGTGLYPTSLSSESLRLPCGSGPDIVIDGSVHRTAVRTTASRLLAGEEVPARTCGSDSQYLGTGEHRVTVAGNGAFRAARLVLTEADAAAPTARYVGVDGGTVAVPPSPTDASQLVVMGHNQNVGWRASVGGQDVRSVVVNGWQQGWVVGPGGGTLKMTFAPDRLYRGGLALGAFLVVALISIVIRRGREWPEIAAAPRVAPRWGGWATLGVGIVAISLVGGGVGVVAALLGFVVGRWAHTRIPALTGALAPAAVAVAGLYFLVEPWGGISGWAGVRSTPALLVALALGSLLERLVGQRVSFKRIKGFSTS
ncbi:DUF3367 domain-containing protein [Aeromicrobium sp. A1-2]|uniref:DUF3367 domain-containing protein n=1 Tax=Aeromicrobium sp. A1-2 TaxID=2107713 RepID=UPI0013C2AF9A|nr:DUF3367 domain-containing protein [Aeromicrobium sp. A1-2]